MIVIFITHRLFSKDPFKNHVSAPGSTAENTLCTCNIILILLIVVFGFAETVFARPERGQEYQIQAGFLSGGPNTGFLSNITLVLGSAGTTALL